MSGRMKAKGSLLELLLNSFDGLTGGSVIGLNGEGLFKFFQSLFQHPFGQIDASQIAVGVVVCLIPSRLNRLLEPRNRLVELPEVDEIGPNVVVGIAEVRIDGDRLLAFLNRFVVTAQETEGPTQKRVGLRSRTAMNRFPVQNHGPLQVSLHLAVVGFLEELQGSFHLGADVRLFPRGLSTYPLLAWLTNPALKLHHGLAADQALLLFLIFFLVHLSLMSDCGHASLGSYLEDALLTLY